MKNIEDCLDFDKKKDIEMLADKAMIAVLLLTVLYMQFTVYEAIDSYNNVTCLNCINKYIDSKVPFTGTQNNSTINIDISEISKYNKVLP
jgi:hypothetical protein